MNVTFPGSTPFWFSHDFAATDMTSASAFELTNMAGKATRGVFKDVVALPPRKTATIDFVADNPGLALLHCHMQDHQDFGFMSLVRYAEG